MTTKYEVPVAAIKNHYAFYVEYDAKSRVTSIVSPYVRYKIPRPVIEAFYCPYPMPVESHYNGDMEMYYSDLDRHRGWEAGFSSGVAFARILLMQHMREVIGRSYPEAKNYKGDMERYSADCARYDGANILYWSMDHALAATNPRYISHVDNPWLHMSAG